MKPSPPGGRKQPPPVTVRKPIPEGPSGFDCDHPGNPSPVYPDVAWAKDAPPRPPKDRMPPPVVVVATDGSVGCAPRVGFAAGWAWVSERGKADVGVIKAADVRVAELAAIAAACAATELSGCQLHILSDSMAAIQATKDIIEGRQLTGVSERYAGPIRKRAASTGLTIQWVKGHNGHLLNEIADRLALMARRRHQARVDGDVHEIARAIARRELKESA